MTTTSPSPTPRIGRTLDTSVERWPEPVRPPAGAPNLLVIVLDDVGFAQLGCFGGTIATPNIDRLAASGLRFPNFHTTALCSPTRASLLTGRHPHAVGFGCVTERTAGFPGYSMQLPDSAATVAEVLRDQGYSTRAVGKWHLTPSFETGPQGPYDRWPLGRGFQRFYGFLAGVADQFTPELVRDNSLTSPPRTPEEGYHLSEDLVDDSIASLSELVSLAPHQPFFHYLGFGAAHAPHQVPPEWIEPYRGAFDHGWDEERRRILARQIELGIFPEGTELGQSNPGVTPWDELPEGDRRAMARMMEVYAGFLTHTDAQIGRLLDRLEEWGVLDDTVVVLMSDNGASAEGGAHGLVDPSLDDTDLDDPAVVAQLDRLGGPELNNHYPWGWAQAGNTPFRWYKQFTFAGGITDGLVISWPGGGLPAGELRHQYHHVIDVAPTLLDLAGISWPTVVRGVTQQPVDGVSMRYAFHDPDAPTARTAQHYEMWGNRGYWRDGWMAVSRLHPTAERAQPRVDPPARLSDATWELFHHPSDPTERHDLAEQHPELLQELVDLWWAAAGRHQVLPVDIRARDRRWPSRVPTPPGADLDHWVFHGPGGTYERGGAPRLHNTSFTMTAELEVGDTTPEGMLYLVGGRHGGYAWYLDAGTLVFENARSPLDTERLAVACDLASGAHRLGLEVRLVGDTTDVRLFVDGNEAGRAGLGAPIRRFNVHKARHSVGLANDVTPHRSYELPFRLTAQLHRLVVDVEPVAAPVQQGEVSPEPDEDALRQQ